MAKKTIIVNGYAYPSIDPQLLQQTVPSLTLISNFSYGLTESGSLLPLEDQAILDIVIPSGVKPLMVLTALSERGNFDGQAIGRLLNSPQAQENLIDEILQTLRTKDMFGVDFDFEYIPVEDKTTYADLIRRTRERLNAEGYLVTAAVAPKTSSDQTGLLYEGHDYALIGAAANLTLLMTYEWGYTYSEPMAVAPIPQVRRVIEYGLTQIPAQQILMGIPNYGYDWILPHVPGQSRARLIGNEEAVWLAGHYGAEIQFDEAAQSPWFYYWDDDGRQHEVWFEDARSIRAKLSLVEEYDLAGVSYWNLMRPFAANWEVLNEMFEVAKL